MGVIYGLTFMAAINISRSKLAATAITLIAVSMSIGFIIGHFSFRPEYEQKIVSYYQNLIEDYNEDGQKNLVRLVDAEKIRENFRRVIFILNLC